MNLPPLPETHLKNKVEKFYTAADMHFYGERCIAAYKKRVGRNLQKKPPKFDAALVARIRDKYLMGDGYKDINRVYPMCRDTYFNIIKRRGAYK